MSYPHPANPAVSAAMRRNLKTGSRPEVLVRRYLRAAGYTGYRLHWKVPGTPDLAFPGRHIAVFVHGCYWHQCRACAIPLPRNNVEYWQRKLHRNVERDERNIRRLRSLGWRVVIIWECAVRRDKSASIAELVKVLAVPRVVCRQVGRACIGPNSRQKNRAAGRRLIKGRS
jgi:DNA mismatch endonuclease, patch repair protein